ncbi:trihelix transcription factor GTL1-like [Cynara cardunculus var. scolymus]|uniref:Myb/SANT-like DNA-binding domain-containing protein n=1 Tax=Cynara cardunculus var. scolymus TaxID=59895 RepID=A0A103Y0C8_CYNCS|nr:trihelix transcription factor GTL1-like [Cynara cardunculus var. scolymus]XP_024983489.1 trihelix transcription factor GTL1-like [Cynara cardunculus var. scolymus]KVI00206.1 hypothetical protein Ccrd_021531 [Cynara cardunculus var. scolymus]
MNLMNRIDDEPSLGFMETKILNPSTSYLSFGKGKADDNLNDHNISDEDEPSFMEDDNSNKGRKGSSPWQRMKWSDSRVRLLIQVVACVGDDGTLDGGSSRKSVCLQKKGKWKTVSKIMVTKGCQVSPQQCEDKFNDLNKRYKRLNDILGRGTSCRVVENPSLMESMPRLSAKTKEDVKKILNSKHLFYPEMCAYHNGQRIPNCTELDLMQVRETPVIGQCSKENNRSSDEGEDSDGSDDDDDDDSDHEDDEHKNGGEDGHLERGNSRFRDEINEVFEDPNNSKLQKKEWVKKRMLQLQEQRIGIEAEAFEMEKRRFKWQRFCDRKDRELEISRLENERSMLENERMALQLKHREHVVESE